MAQFAVNAQRFDPYKNFKFRIKWDNKPIAGVSKVSMLKRTTEVVKHREGGDPSSSRKSPGRTEYEAITLANGLKILFIEDSTLEKSACSISVGTGSLQDLDRSLGLAHFLEHMLFMGSKKFPVHNEYSSFIN